MKKNVLKLMCIVTLSLVVVSSCKQSDNKLDDAAVIENTDTVAGEDFEITAIKQEMEQLAPFEVNDTTSIHIAKHLSCGVVIKNPNPNDAWAEKALSGLDRKAFIDMVFDAVYSSKIQAYEYMSDNKLSIADVKELEKELSRDKIGKIQFVEEWFIDPDKFTLAKRVRSAMFAYENNVVEGVVETYRPGIKVNFNLQ